MPAGGDEYSRGRKGLPRPNAPSVRRVGVPEIWSSYFWAIISFVIPLSTQPVLWDVARISRPVVFVGFAFHSGLSVYVVIAANIVTYLLVGLLLEGLSTVQYAHRAQ